MTTLDFQDSNIFPVVRALVAKASGSWVRIPVTTMIFSHFFKDVTGYITVYFFKLSTIIYYYQVLRHTVRHLTYCKVGMYLHKLIIILYHWLRLIKFPSPALIFLNYLNISYLLLSFL